MSRTTEIISNQNAISFGCMCNQDENEPKKMAFQTNANAIFLLTLRKLADPWTTTIAIVTSKCEQQQEIKLKIRWNVVSRKRKEMRKETMKRRRSVWHTFSFLIFSQLYLAHYFLFSLLRAQFTSFRFEKIAFKWIVSFNFKHFCVSSAFAVVFSEWMTQTIAIFQSKWN